MSGSSVSSIARIGLVIGGAFVGGMVGMPGVGAAIGGMLGGLLFPEKLPGVSGPRLGDQQITSSTEGTAIPLVYGAHVVQGNFIWAAPLEEVENTDKQGGKGGPSQKVTTYTYFLSFAIGLCEGTITGIPRIWENGKLIYDRRPQQDGESSSDYAARLSASDELDEQLTIYLGDEEQLPDSLIESHEGVGEVSAHRGLAYVVFERRDVTDFGGRPAQYQFEVTRAEIVYTPTTELASDFLPAWLPNKDPRIPEVANAYDYRYSVTWYANVSGAITELETSLGITLDPELIGWHRGGTVLDVSKVHPIWTVDPGEAEILSLHYNEHTELILGDYYDVLPLAGNVCTTVALGGVDPGDDRFYWTGIFDDGTLYNPGSPLVGMWQFSEVVGPTPDYSPAILAGADHSQNCTGYPDVFGYFPNITAYADNWVNIRRFPIAPVPEEGPEDWPIDPDDYTWDPGTGQVYSKQPYVNAAGDYLWLNLYDVDAPANLVNKYPLGPVFEVGDAAATEAVWTAARNAAILNGYAVGSTYDATGMGGVDTYPRYINRAWSRTFIAITYSEGDGVTVGSIVRDQCERSGLTSDIDFDVSELDKLIHGYKVERIMSGRDIIAPLRQYALFDGLETDKLRFPLRGGDVVATLTDDDLGAHEPGSSPPALVEAQRVEDIELPYAVRVRYADTDSEYQPGAQLATMKVTAGKSAVDVETTIAMDATAAIQMAEIMQQESVQRREDYALKIGPHLLYLTATDPIMIPLRGELQRCMIAEDTRALPGIIEAKAVRDDQSIYVSNATGTAGGAGQQTLTPIGDTDLLIIDSAALGSGSNDAGVFLAACGASDRWTGYGLFESTDGGSNYSRIAAYETASTMGTLLDAIPEGPFELWDYENEILVAMDNGTLESRTQDEVLNGANAMFVGADGRWEVIQFASAIAESVDSGGRVIYRLSTLLRGRQGTEWAIGSSQAGDRMALCITTQRLAMEVAAVGIPRLFKSVSFGRTTESGPTQTFTPQGVALKPYAPWLPEGQRDGSENLDIYAVRRTRISSEWMDSDYVPLNEDIEAYEVDIVADGSPDTVLRTLTGSIFPIAYSAALQTTDFGSPQGAILVRIYQISASVGRGYMTEATL